LLIRTKKLFLYFDLFYIKGKISSSYAVVSALNVLQIKGEENVLKSKKKKKKLVLLLLSFAHHVKFLFKY